LELGHPGGVNPVVIGAVVTGAKPVVTIGAPLVATTPVVGVGTTAPYIAIQFPCA